jgi:DNA-binding MarR family transcriptional regulator
MNRHKTDTTFLLEELTNNLIGVYDRMLQSNFQISYSEWRLLFAIFLAQDNPTQENIAAQALKSPAAVSRQLNTLIEKDLVERGDSKDSKRIKLVYLSKTGKNVFNKSVMQISKFSHNFFRQLGTESVAFKDNLVALIEDLENNKHTIS